MGANRANGSPKKRLKWTKDLHDLFEKIVNQIGGPDTWESYAGKYVLELDEIIHDNNEDPSLFIDLRGIMMENPETNDAEDWKEMVVYDYDLDEVISRKTGIFVHFRTCSYACVEWRNRFNAISVHGENVRQS